MSLFPTLHPPSHEIRGSKFALHGFPNLNIGLTEIIEQATNLARPALKWRRGVWLAHILLSIILHLSPIQYIPRRVARPARGLPHCAMTLLACCGCERTLCFMGASSHLKFKLDLSAVRCTRPPNSSQQNSEQRCSNDTAGCTAQTSVSSSQNLLLGPRPVQRPERQGGPTLSADATASVRFWQGKALAARISLSLRAL